MPPTVDYVVTEAVATITLNRPGTMNALDFDLKVALRDAVIAAADDTGVRAVVLTGSGRAFCAGQDLTEHARDLADAGADTSTVWTTVAEHYAPITRTLATMPKPVVAAVNGVAAGAGAGFALACDFRIVAETAGFNLAFAAVGLAADSGATWTLPRLVGMARAKQLLLMPKTISAREALELGLATEVVPDETVLPTALQLARELAHGPTIAYGALKRSLVFSAGHSLDEALEFEAEMMTHTGATADHRDAVRAFGRKDRPHFEGR